MSNDLEEAVSDADRILALLGEYTDKLRRACERKLAQRRRRFQAVAIYLILAAIFTVVLALILPAAQQVQVPDRSIWIASAVLGIFLIASIISWTITLGSSWDFEASHMARTVERLVRTASQYGEHASRNITNRFEFDLRLAEAETALLLFEKTYRTTLSTSHKLDSPSLEIGSTMELVKKERDSVRERWQAERSTAPLSGNKLFDTLVRSSWVLVFDPKRRNAHKMISFGMNGIIGLGHNQNESSWRLVGDKLEILNSDGRVYSRFNFDSRTGGWVHTNDPDTPSVRSQRILPQ